MSYPVVPNTFANSTTADATQVNANFTAIINGITDGTKDINVHQITANGTLIAPGTLSASTAQIGTVVASGLSANTGYLANGIISSAVVSGMSADSLYVNNFNGSNVNVSALSANTINVNNFTVATFTPSNIITTGISANSAYFANASISSAVVSGMSADSGYFANAVISSGFASGFSANSGYFANGVISSFLVSGMSANSIYAANLTIGSGTPLSFFSETTGILIDNLQVSSHFSGTYYGQTFGNLKTIVLNYLGAITMTATQFCYMIAHDIAPGLVQTSLSNSPLAVPVAVNAIGSVVIYDGVFQYNTNNNTYTLTMGNPGAFNSGVSFVFPGLAVKFV
jgi:hypothetical protein